MSSRRNFRAAKRKKIILYKEVIKKDIVVNLLGYCKHVNLIGHILHKSKKHAQFPSVASLVCDSGILGD